MIGMKNYLNTYVDRRMKFVVEEWNLSRGSDMDDFTSRLDAIGQEIPRLKAFGHAASGKLTELENRARRLKERV